MNNSSIEIFKTVDGKTQVQVKLENDAVWLTQYQLEELSQTNRTSVNLHISNIYKSQELKKDSTYAKIAQVQKEGEREISRNIHYYNLDIIIAAGYRVKSKRGTQFQILANKIIKDYLMKGYSLNGKKLIQQNEQLKELKQKPVA